MTIVNPKNSSRGGRESDGIRNFYRRARTCSSKVNPDAFQPDSPELRGASSGCHLKVTANATFLPGD
jgi:hypothetical protein